MNNIENTLADIIKSLFTSPFEGIRKRNLTGTIDVGNGKSIYISQTVDLNILKVSRMMYEQNRNARETHDVREWRAIIRSAIGRSLPLEIDNTDCFEGEAKKLKRRLDEELEKYYSGYGDLKTAYGCWLFTPLPKKTIKIGPVCFEDRLLWLDRTFEHGELSKITHSRLFRAFSRKHLRKRKPSIDQHHEETMRRRISNAPMVCEVTTTGLATNLAYKRSAIAANLALTSISLIWPTPSSVLVRFRTTLDNEPRISYDFQIAAEKRKVVSWQWEGLLSTYYVGPDEWEAYYSEAGRFFKIAGEMIGCWTSTKISSEASQLLLSLSRSLFFFWNACLERNDLLATVKFASSLEALTYGGKEGGILKLIEARFNLSGDDEYAQNKSLNDIIKKIYRFARSRTLHGTNEAFLLDWSETRTIAECLARDCLVGCMEFAQNRWKGKETRYFLEADES